MTGTCKCEGNWVGSACDTCAPGYGGQECEKPTREVGLVVGALLAVIVTGAVIGGVVWWCTQRSRGQGDFGDTSMDMELEGRKVGGVDEVVELEESEDSEEGRKRIVGEGESLLM